MRPLLTLILPISCYALLSGCNQNAPSKPPAKIVVVAPVTANMNQRMTLPGEIRARHESDLAFRVGGKLSARLVDNGASIQAGQALARLDPSDLKLATESSAAQLKAAESEYATTKSERDRYAGLMGSKFISASAFEAKQNAFKAATSRLEQARSQYELSHNQIRYTSLSSDYPAVIAAVLADAGQVVSAGQPIFRIARPDELEVAISVPEANVEALKSAKEISVRLWSKPDASVSGILREISAVADPGTRTYPARIKITPPYDGIRIGMSAQVIIADRSASPTLRVPLSAVINTGNGPFVRIVEKNVVQSRRITVDSFSEQGAHVLSGLHPGDNVIVSGATLLTDGEQVSPTQLPAAQQQR